jgi:hypothetical protein
MLSISDASINISNFHTIKQAWIGKLIIHADLALQIVKSASNINIRDFRRRLY